MVGCCHGGECWFLSCDFVLIICMFVGIVGLFFALGFDCLGCSRG